MWEYPGTVWRRRSRLIDGVAHRRYRPAMRFGPPVSYTHNQDGSRLAYQVLGDGDLDLVLLSAGPPTSR
jgi:hypothetical protein